MKIVIQGKIIDTENIYCIGEIVEDEINSLFLFSIKSLNGHKLKVHIDKYDKNCKTVEWDELRKNTPDLEQPNEQIEYLYNLMRYGVPEENKSRLEKMRLDIYNIWSENQSKLPNFEIKNY
jgi:hypothetical protein